MEHIEPNNQLNLFENNEAMQNVLMEQANEILDTLLDFKAIMMYYSAAIRRLRTKLEILNTEFEVKYQRNPISNIQSRLKSQVSIMEKLNRKGLPITKESIEENIHDIAGVRVICSYVDDIYRLADALVGQDDIELVVKKDYIVNPKPNGYRSLHLIVRLPVYFTDGTHYVTAEIQIRTIAMDFWASLEHQIKYKKKINNPEVVAGKLKQCADIISYTDIMMQNIRKEMDDEQAEDADLAEQLYEKLKRFDVTLGE